MIYLDDRLRDEFLAEYGPQNAPHIFAILKGIAGEKLHGAGFPLNFRSFHPTDEPRDLQLIYLEHHSSTFYSDQPLSNQEVRQVYEVVRQATAETHDAAAALVNMGLLHVDESDSKKKH